MPQVMPLGAFIGPKKSYEIDTYSQCCKTVIIVINGAVCILPEVLTQVMPLGELIGPKKFYKIDTNGPIS
jgi:hypothetical protein